MSTPQPPMPQAAAPNWQAGAPGSPYPTYTSPIPVVRTHLGHVIASEWTKIRSVRSTMWTLGVFVLLVVGIGVLVATLVSTNAGEGDLAYNNPLSFGVFGLLLGSMCIITLGVLTTASEYGTGMIRTTMTACPSRGRVLAAKAIVFFSVAFTVTFVSVLLVALADVGMLDGAEKPSGGEWLKGTLGISLYIALLGLLSLVVGSIIRHSAGAITLMIGLVLAPLVIALFMFSSALEDLRQALFDYSIPNQLGAFYTTSLSKTGPTGWDPLWIALGVTAAAFMRRGRAAAEARRLASGPGSEPRRVTGPLHPRGAAVLRVPARLVPVAAVVDARVLRPGHDMRDAGGDHLLAAGAAIGLALRAGARDVPHAPLLALPALRRLPAAVAAGTVVLGAPSGRVRRVGSLGSVATRGHGTPHGAIQEARFHSSLRGADGGTRKGPVGATAASADSADNPQIPSPGRVLGTCQTVMRVGSSASGPRKQEKRCTLEVSCWRPSSRGRARGRRCTGRSARPRSPKRPVWIRSGWPSTTSCPTGPARRRSPWRRYCSAAPAGSGWARR